MESACLLCWSRLWRLVLVAALLQVYGCASLWRPEDAERLAGRTYVITGASSGFGQGVALELAAHGANVVLAARRTALLEEVAAQARAAGGEALVVTTDVSRPGEVGRLAAAAVERFGQIDVWINNAGVVAIGRFWEIPIEDHARLIDVNLNGVIYGSHVAIQQFRAQGFGTLVNIGSVESELPLANHASYAASKAAVPSLGRSLNEELRLSGLEKITVTTVLPWAADTPIWEHAANYSGHQPRMILVDDPQEVVDAIVWASLYPKEEVNVGWKASASYWTHKLLPDVAEYIAAGIVEEQLEMAAPAPPTAGTLHAPMPSGRTLRGGLRERMQEEEMARASAAPDDGE